MLSTEPKAGVEEVFIVTDYYDGPDKEPQATTGSFVMKKGVVLRQ